MDIRALFKLSYGMYLINTKHEGKMNGQIANVCVQITDKPARIVICLNKKNLTCDMIHKSKVFTLITLSEEANMKFIGNFGFKSGKEINKFENINYTESKLYKLPVIKDFALSYMEAKVEQEIEIGDYRLFVALVEDSELLSEGKPMTYAYYHEVKGGLTSKNAPTFADTKSVETKKEEASMKKYKCAICGYVYDPAKGDPDSGIKPGTPFENIPADWKCPVCGVTKDNFDPID